MPSGLQLAVTFCSRPTSVSVLRVAGKRVLLASAAIGVERVLMVRRAHGSDPNAPPFIAATQSSTPLAAAIGAWTIGTSMPTNSRNRRFGQPTMCRCWA